MKRSGIVLLSTMITFWLVSTGCMEEQMVENVTLQAEKIVYLGSSLHGIAIDPLTGTLYIGKGGNTVMSRTASGTDSIFARIPGADGSYTHGGREIYLFDLHRRADGSFLGAAKDRIISIDRSGAVSPILDGLFAGTYGVCGITEDRNGMIYFSINGRGIFSLAAGQKEPVEVAAVPGIVGVELSPDERFLYVCDDQRNRLVVIDIRGKKEIDEIATSFMPEYMLVEGTSLFVKGPLADTWLEFDISTTNKPVAIRQYDVTGVSRSMYGIQTTVFAREGDTDVLYGTCWDSGELYRVELPARK